MVTSLYKLLVVFYNDVGEYVAIHSQVIEFPSRESAMSAKEEIAKEHAKGRVCAKITCLFK